MRAALLQAVLVAVAAASSCSSPTTPERGSFVVITPSSTIRLFDGTSLDNFETWLVDRHSSDPDRVFSVKHIDGAPAIRISGTTFGGLITRQAYRSYRLIAEFRWGGPTWGDRAASARDSGVLLHAQGRLGNTAKDFNGPWLQSIEFQVMEGAVGDIIPVAGYDEGGTRIRPAIDVKTTKDRDGEDVYDAAGALGTFSSGRVNWWGRSEDWVDRTGFRGARDVETPNLGWTHIEAVVEGNNLTYFVNGQLVNAGSGATFAEGKIMIQSEGAEIYFRKIDLEPLK